MSLSLQKNQGFTALGLRFKMNSMTVPASLNPKNTGRIGGKKRAENLSPERRQEIAKKASLAAKEKRDSKRHANTPN